MLDQIGGVMDAYDRGLVSRRQLIGILGGLVAAAAAGSAAPARASETQSTLKSVGLNHIALRVPDVPRARDFYVKHLGLSVLQEDDRACFLACGGNHFVALFRADQAELDHYCYTIDDYDPSRVVETLRAAGFEPERRQDRVYFEDLNGLTVQVAGEWNDYPGGRP